MHARQRHALTRLLQPSPPGSSRCHTCQMSHSLAELGATHPGCPFPGSTQQLLSLESFLLCQACTVQQLLPADFGWVLGPKAIAGPASDAAISSQRVKPAQHASTWLCLTKINSKACAKVLATQTH